MEQRFHANDAGVKDDQIMPRKEECERHGGKVSCKWCRSHLDQNTRRLLRLKQPNQRASTLALRKSVPGEAAILCQDIVEPDSKNLVWFSFCYWSTYLRRLHTMLACCLGMQVCAGRLLHSLGFAMWQWWCGDFVANNFFIFIFHNSDDEEQTRCLQCNSSRTILMWCNTPRS